VLEQERNVDTITRYCLIDKEARKKKKGIGWCPDPGWNKSENGRGEGRKSEVERNG